MVADQISGWSRLNFMKIYAKKAKQMMFDSIPTNTPPLIRIKHGLIEHIEPRSIQIVPT
jgi:hypothetical protein